MSKEIPTPYVWTFQPQMGTAAGASQDYSTKLNWLSAGNKMIQQVNNIRETRNRILARQAAITETPRKQINPDIWPAPFIDSPNYPPMTVFLPRNEIRQQFMTDHGMQLAGGGKNCLGAGIQLNEQLPVHRYRLRSDGIFQLGGGARQPLSENNLIMLKTSPTVPRSGGIGTWQFTQEFVPTVYFNPFSGTPETYPDEFIFNYDSLTDSVDGYN